MRRQESTYDRTEVLTGAKVKLIPFLRQKNTKISNPMLSITAGERLTFNAALSERMSLDEAHSVLFARRSDNNDFMIVVERDAIGAKGVKFAKVKSGARGFVFRVLAGAIIAHYGDQGGKVQHFAVTFDPEIGAWAVTPKYQEGGES